MSGTDGRVLVTGATGKQGGAAAAALLRDGWRVRALTRDPSSPAARALAAAGAEVVRGEMADRASLDAAVRGADGVFSVQRAAGVMSGGAVDDEVRLGVNVADAALAAGVRHLVYTSVGGADRNTGVPSWETKAVIERHIADIGLSATVLRPVMFMENHASPWVGVRPDGTLRSFLPADRKIQQIAVEDIGAFAALAFADPDAYAGRAIELAGDELTFTEITAAISAAAGRPVRFEHVTPEEMYGELGAPVRALSSADAPVWRADIPALRAEYPPLLTFDAWLKKTGARLIEARLAA
ncbi:MAG TPA: NmrA/HSCARG family protein [Streptosporangiaceae bacterium]